MRLIVASGVPMPPATPSTDAGHHALECMEIWGTNDLGDRTANTPGVDVHVHSKPHAAAKSGGDIHYVSVCGSGRITRTLLADIAGHGMAVDGIARQLRDLVRKNINNPFQMRLVRDLNNQFTALDKNKTASSPGAEFATAVVATILPRKNRLTLCNAGHPRPLFYSTHSKTWRLLIAEKESDGDGDLPLGIAPEIPYHQFAIPFTPGDILVLYTDGLIEATNPANTQLGEEGLLAMVQNLPTDSLPAAVAAFQSRLDAFRSTKPSDDDLTLLFLRRTGNTRVSHSVRERLRVYGRLLGVIKDA